MRRALSLAVAALAAGLAQAAAPATPEVFIPGFWNLDAIPPKPDLRGLTTIRFITADNYPPFDFTAPDGTMVGFNVDLARALCVELAVACTIQSRAWGSIIPALKAGEGDAAIASLAISDAAQREVDFTRPYYKTPARFVVLRTSPIDAVSPASLAGKTVGVQSGTAHEAYLGLFFPKAVIKPFPSPEAARTALKAGQADALFGDGIAAALWQNGTDAAACCRFAGGPYTESRFFGRGSGIAVKPGAVVLRQALDYALARVAARGIYGDVYLKYFPIGFY